MINKLEKVIEVAGECKKHLYCNDCKYNGICKRKLGGNEIER